MSDHTAETKNFDLKKMGFLFLGVAIFAVVYWSPAWSDAVAEVLHRYVGTDRLAVSG